MADSAAVSILPKRFHGCIHLRQKEGELGDPKVAQLFTWSKGLPHLKHEHEEMIKKAQLLTGSKGLPHLRCKGLVMVVHVPHKSEQVNY